MSLVRALFFIIASLLITGCGGGGDDKTSISISVTKADFQLTQNINVYEPVMVNVQFNGDGLVVGYPAGVSDPGWLQIEVLNSNSNSALVKLSFVPYWQVGKYSTTVRFVTGRQDGSNLSYVDLPVTAEVVPQFSALAPAMDFQQVIGAGQLTKPLEGYKIDIQGPKAVWTVTSNVDWLTFDKTSGTGAASVNVKVAKNAGDGNGIITIVDSISSRSVQFNVRVTRELNAAKFGPEALEFSVSPTTILTELVKTVNITDAVNSTVPELAVTWSFKKASVPWLKVDKVEGSTATPQAVQVSADSAVNSLPIGTVNETLVFSYVTSDKVSHDVEIPVKFTSTLPSIQVVTPYIVKPNVAGTLTLRGYGFDQLSANSKIKIGDNSYPIKSLQSDTQLKIDHPALAAGRYSISLEISSHLPLYSGTLVVQASEVMPEQTISAPGLRRVMTYDPERKRIYTYNNSSSELEVFSYQQGSWAKTHTRSFAQPNDLELTKDGKQLLATVGPELWTIDITQDQLPVAMLLSVASNWNCNQYFKGVVTLNDNKVAMSSDYSNCSGHTNTVVYDLNLKKVFGNYFAYNSTVAASGDGSRLLIGQSGLTPAQDIMLIDTLNYQTLPTSTAASVPFATMNYDGSKIIAGTGNNQVFDHDLKFLGTLCRSHIKFNF